jgi:hypothetical protein
MAAVFICTARTACTANERRNDDWSIIWRQPTPTPVAIEVEQLGGLGKDLENRKWLMISTDYHQIYYQPSTDKKKVSEVYYLIDNVYEFLKGRSPAKLKTPIKAFLVPNERGRSRCDRMCNAMRTGDQGDILFIITSLLHEETHLFNFAFLDDVPQGWWTGEFTCIYFQQRALWQAQEKNVKTEISSRLPNGPRCRLHEMDKRGKEVFDEAFSALYFFEEKYGLKKSQRFRQACLEESKRTKGGLLPYSVFAEVFGMDIERLEQEWLQFYEWESPGKRRSARVPDLRLRTKISYAVDKASVQNVVQKMANKAGLQYNRTKSALETQSLCRRWLKRVDIKDQPLDQALKEILGPLSLIYKLEGNAIVLYRK